MSEDPGLRDEAFQRGYKRGREDVRKEMEEKISELYDRIACLDDEVAILKVQLEHD